MELLNIIPQRLALMVAVAVAVMVIVHMGLVKMVAWMLLQQPFGYRHPMGQKQAQEVLQVAGIQQEV